jgi:glycerol-3-phosphate dehydrogenase (NAD(P)+)
MKIAIIGAGKWGQALYHAYSRNNEVVISSRKKREIENFVSMDEALNYEYLVMAIPAQFVREWMEENFVDHGQKLLVAAKGIETDTGAFLNEVYGTYVDANRLAFISGPSFAAEVKQSLPTALIISSTNLDLAQKYADALPKNQKYLFLLLSLCFSDAITYLWMSLLTHKRKRYSKAKIIVIK